MRKIDLHTRELLLAAKAPTTLANFDDILQFAVRSGHLSLIALSIIQGANVNHCYEDKETPLHRANHREQPRVIQHLLDKKAKKDSYDHHHFTPLHHAVMHCFISNIEILIKADVSININETGYTPLFCLAYFSNKNSEKPSLEKQADTVEYLIERNALVDLRPFHKLPPVYYFAYYGNKAAVRHLLRAGAKTEIEVVHDSKASKNKDEPSKAEVLAKADSVIALIQQEEKFWKKMGLFETSRIRDIVTDYAGIFPQSR